MTLRSIGRWLILCLLMLIIGGIGDAIFADDPKRLDTFHIVLVSTLIVAGLVLAVFAIRPWRREPSTQPASDHQGALGSVPEPRATSAGGRVISFGIGACLLLWMGFAYQVSAVPGSAQVVLPLVPFATAVATSVITVLLSRRSNALPPHRIGWFYAWLLLMLMLVGTYLVPAVILVFSDSGFDDVLYNDSLRDWWALLPVTTIAICAAWKSRETR